MQQSSNSDTHTHINISYIRHLQFILVLGQNFGSWKVKGNKACMLVTLLVFITKR